MIARSGAKSLLTDRAHSEIAHALAGPDVAVIVCDGADGPGSMTLDEGLAPAAEFLPIEVAESDLAYILFTSGTTGVPKAVGVTHGNVRAFLDHIAATYDFQPGDRFSQMFELTFDLSVFDMFACWEAGATLCVPNASQRVSPASYIVSRELTVWFSVPSVGLFLQKLGVLKEGRFPTLRRSLFCGEALPDALAGAWASAAAASTVDNLYGPTELTIACTAHRWAPGDRTERALVPIGRPFPSMTALVVDEACREVEDGSAGELVMSGPQLTPGYLDSPEATAKAYVVPPGRTTRFYRTGDRVRRSPEDGSLSYLGRLDDQVKVNGHRVELGEVEAAAREILDGPTVAAVAYPETETGFSGIVLFVESAGCDGAAIIRDVSTILPHYMVPRAVVGLDALPLNDNSKIDRKALVRHLDDGVG
jgi:amino acid adenylation domain-containing protein